ncbi:hypothetical protein BATDEDRAFT_87641 [Batrachochytrium dendrobatidis JAM81]|uniref:Uncharacterized protein n=2 Tax=Batrachochytrium dendrobatidis TaxID=109871 RepID=F4P0V9_BATDJ|nr:uncharacterized protein BATDEDRAFT_87641 [Batrachochytrium dendrobatidis JAM81]EGF81658.1 hypothetical protein BATDEDRAFT_87641 [Batrachochytrium dendrobatidis JAM81]OAJ37992.1 hypothetical protein BDEG_21961 [Batrachochytrium dendrobatidis JEL423]|eukprot:XP_006678280.1 hypothetical protein BATDEDRAFT_87641 [Batrachochytrium dendrobatidis JAM81]
MKFIDILFVLSAAATANAILVSDNGNDSVQASSTSSQLSGPTNEPEPGTSGQGQQYLHRTGPSAPKRSRKRPTNQPGPSAPKRSRKQSMDQPGPSTSNQDQQQPVSEEGMSEPSHSPEAEEPLEEDSIKQKAKKFIEEYGFEYEEPDSDSEESSSDSEEPDSDSEEVELKFTLTFTNQFDFE